ncbi:MAG: ADOP family duplicated permease [Terracidiphilus sp.]
MRNAMRWLRAFWMRLGGVVRGRSADANFAAELEAHVAMHTEDGIRARLSPEEARRRALVMLGGVEQTRQAQRERRTLPWLENLIQDLRYGVRTLRRSPGFTVTAVLTFALGIGACTAVFSVVNAVLLRSLPYGDPSRLVYLYTPIPSLHLPPEIFSPFNADFFDIQRESRSYSDMSIVDQSTFNLASQGAIERIGAARVDANFFSTLEAYPEFGRAIDTGDQLQGHNRVADISHALWQSMFSGSPDVLKDSISLDGKEYRIVGIMPPEFGYPHNTEIPYGNADVKTTQVWIPLALTPQQKAEREGSNGDAVIARLRPGVTIRQAQSELAAIMTRLDKLHAGFFQGSGALVKSFLGTVVGPVRPLMNMLLGAVLLVLLIACANAASLLLARASDRLRELGVRAALGARRSRIARQLLTESLLIGMAGGAIGVALAWIFLRILPSLNPGNIPRLNEASLDGRVLLFAVGVSLLTSIISGILPALTVSKLDVTGLLNSSGGHAIAGKHSRTQCALIVAEAAMVVVLMACAGLLIRSYINLESVNTGFSRSTVSMKISLDEHPGATPEQSWARRVAFFRGLIARLSALPGVAGAGAVNDLPLSGSDSISIVWVDGYANRNDQWAEARTITPDYFRAMGTPLIAGRAFTEDDISGGAHVAIVNQRFAKIYFANRDPIGGRISGDNKHWDTVVGIVADVRHSSLEAAPLPQTYHPSYEFDSAYIAVRSTLPPQTVAAEARAVTKTIDPNVAVADVHTMGELESEASARRRFQTTLLTLFAAIALLLALAGIYSLMSYSVSRREREMGIRMALGAQRRDVMLLVLRNAAILLSLGLAIGLGCAWFAARIMKAFLFEVGDHDLATLSIACALLAVCGLLAAFVPARRAASVDPMQALRAE